MLFSGRGRRGNHESMTGTAVTDAIRAPDTIALACTKVQKGGKGSVGRGGGRRRERRRGAMISSERAKNRFPPASVNCCEHRRSTYQLAILQKIHKQRRDNLIGIARNACF